ncbi:Low affinity potassium transport system protein kup [Desulfovibrio sp. X2]|uniref:potassium transporter Kup n=1 Tax=Desulfovibrio sp. X2 TaxID=941449 RepID=UPI000358BB43|nr:potassium transporter Kup [Desulfovibrio sp. X2]EPR39777.1 Low affinity potassium transport system protein kup [Desulfovibrio sp. X2]
MENQTHAGKTPLLPLTLTALGVVYGDIGTSPLYALRECFLGEMGLATTHANVLGVLSLIFWALILIISCKYLLFILQADNQGEGGILALMALATHGGSERGVGRLLIPLGLFGAALLYGDGMITPAISVLSAVEGLQVAAPSVQHFIIPLTVAILIGLFMVQRHGTAGVGRVFGPVTLVWFAVLAVMGVSWIVKRPEVLWALDPAYAAAFFMHNGLPGFVVLGAVFLVVTGGEALYADMGHFGRVPIRLAWFTVVLPGLVLNYFGQGALLLERPDAVTNPFYLMAPTWALTPLLLLATAATVIASQAVISGAFSLTMQAVQLGYSPRLAIEHTSATERGQIYVPAVNWLLMICCVGLVIGFESSGALAAAYGIAVTTTMVITTALFYTVARRRWHWSRLAAALPCLGFLVADIAFLGANALKIVHGGWFPLLVAGMFFALMATWKDGRHVLARRMVAGAVPLDKLPTLLAHEPPARVPGTAVFMAGNPQIVPPALLHNLKHNRVLHERVAILTVVTEDRPVVPRSERKLIEPLSGGITRVTLRYGFMQSPNVPRALHDLVLDGWEFDIHDTTFFLGRESLVASGGSGMSGWRERLFAFMSGIARSATAFYGLPPDRIVELGSQVKL